MTLEQELEGLVAAIQEDGAKLCWIEQQEKKEPKHSR
jgi:hypothetical protein